ncbi:MAG: hypothetical protein HGA71_02930 [Azonexaceae bacterium]|nr:hypothetical protein [Azonexaceae bacterium]
MHQQLRLLETIHNSLAIESHWELLHWLQGGVQELVPHTVLIAAWGNFVSGQIFLDVVSPLTSLRTTTVSTEVVLPFLLQTFETWKTAGSEPVSFPLKSGAFDNEAPGATENGAAKYLAPMHWAVVHGMRDERGDAECLYVFLTDALFVDSFDTKGLKLLLPFVDAAFRRVSHLPMQRLMALENTELVHTTQHPDTQHVTSPSAFEGLTRREQEIMRWVSLGKTNPEIGHILCVSPVTVRNHLYRIFRKLGAINRAQAVFQLRQSGLAGEHA